MKINSRFKNTNTLLRAPGLSNFRFRKQILASLLALALVLTIFPQALPAQDAQAQASAQTSQAPPYTTQTPDQLQQLVAPIALYPDSLVAQILAASTFPAQIVEADRWVQANPDLKGDALAQAVDKENWDPSVKALQRSPPSLEIWTKIFPGHPLSAMPTTTRNRT